MLRYTYGIISVKQHQLLWNALFESFIVHARSLYGFLKNEKDSRNMEARDFNTSFQVTNPDKIRGAADKINRQVVHLGKLRTAELSEKIDLPQAAAIVLWIEDALREFLDQLPPKLQKCWNADRADPSKVDSMMTRGPTGPAAPPVPSATNHVTFIKTEQ
jgi:hypothetical protein